MTARHLPHQTRILWLAAASLLMLACAVHLVAQDAEATVEPVTIIVIESTETAELLPSTPVIPTTEPPTLRPSPTPTETPTLPPPTATPTETQPSPEPASTETLPSTTTLAATQMLTDPAATATVIPPTDFVTSEPAAPALDATAETTLPEAVASPSPVSVTPDVLPTATSAPLPPQLQFVAGAPAEADTPQTVALVGSTLASVHSLALACQTDAALFAGTGATAQGLFAVAGTLLDSGFAPDGQWTMVWTRTLPDADSPTPTELIRLRFAALTAEASPLRCQIATADGSGAPLSASAFELTLTVRSTEAPAATPEPMATVAVEATESPTATLEPTAPVDAEATEPPAAPLEVTATLEPIATVDAAPLTPERVVVTPDVAVAPMVRVTGQVLAASPDAAQVVFSGAAMQQAVTPGEDGAFEVWLLAGDYRLRATAPPHAAYETTLYVPDDGLTLPPILLLIGDIDANGTVDRADADILVTSYGLPVPQAQDRADLNGDGRVDLFDLAILAANLSPNN